MKESEVFQGVHQSFFFQKLLQIFLQQFQQYSFVQFPRNSTSLFSKNPAMHFPTIQKCIRNCFLGIFSLIPLEDYQKIFGNLFQENPSGTLLKQSSKVSHYFFWRSTKHFPRSFPWQAFWIAFRNSSWDFLNNFLKNTFREFQRNQIGDLRKKKSFRDSFSDSSMNSFCIFLLGCSRNISIDSFSIISIS